MCIVCGAGAAHLLHVLAARKAAPTRFAAQAVAPAIVSPLDPHSADGMDGPADIILHGGPILTMAATEAEAVAVRAGRVLAVGSVADALACRGRLTRIVDLRGTALLPGFVNAHWHMPYTLLCEWVASNDALPQAVSVTPPGEWIVLADSPGAHAAPSHRLVWADADGNIEGGNALAMAAVDGRLPPHVSGLLPLFARSGESLLRRLKAMLRQTAALGVTCLRVCGLGTLAGVDDLETMRAAMAFGPPLRLRATLDAALWPQWTDLHLAPGFGDDTFRVDTISAWLGDAGLPASLRTAQQAGWAVTVHATGEQMASAIGSLDAGGGLECAAMPGAEQLAAIERGGVSLGLPAGEGHPAEMPISFGLDAAMGPSAPLDMVHKAVAAGRFGVRQALAAVTIDAARRCGAGDILGSIAPRKYADFAFLDRDPREVRPDQLAGIACTATWVAGREAFRRSPSPAACG